MMNVNLSINFNLRVDAEDIEFEEIAEQFDFLVNESNKLLGKDIEWYDAGYSRKQALTHMAFNDYGITQNIFSKWSTRYEKNRPLFIEGICGGHDDDFMSKINYRKAFLGEKNRVFVSCEICLPVSTISISNVEKFITHLAIKFNCSSFLPTQRVTHYTDEMFFQTDCLQDGYPTHLR